LNCSILAWKNTNFFQNKKTIKWWCLISITHLGTLERSWIETQWNASEIPTFFLHSRINQLVSKHLSTQGRLDLKGGLCCFWCPNKAWTPLIGASSTQKIIINTIELRKLWPPKVEGSRTQENKPPNVTKASFFNKKTIHCLLLCCYWSSKMICRTSTGTPIAH